MKEKNDGSIQVTIEIPSQNKITNTFYLSEKSKLMKIEDLLENDDYFNDLREKPHSRYIRLLTTDNIKKLIDYTLNPNVFSKKDNNNDEKLKRYPYYSCQILCSKHVLYFSKSIEEIEKYDKIERNKENRNKPNEEIDYYRSRSKSVSDSKGNSFKDSFEDFNIEEGMHLSEEIREKNFEDFFKFKRDYGSEEKYIAIIETEYQRESLSQKEEKKYNEKEINIIYEIIGEIFKKLKFS